jgi:hypothetical protein
MADKPAATQQGDGESSSPQQQGGTPSGPSQQQGQIPAKPEILPWLRDGASI